MNEFRKLICWSPHARDGIASAHGQEFMVCSSSLRLFRASTNSSSSTHLTANNTSSNGSAMNPSAAVTSTEHSPQQMGVPMLAPATAALMAQSDNTSSSGGVNLYKPSTYDTTEPQPRTSFTLIDSIAYPGQAFKCIGWSHARASPYMVAGGHQNGKLVVMNFNASSVGGGLATGNTYDYGAPSAASSNADVHTRIVKEFHPRYARACQVVCWNPVHTSQVATGLDRVRNGCGTLIWDLEQKGTAVTIATAAPMPTQTNSSFVGVNGNAANSMMGMNSVNILNTNRSALPSQPQSIETVTEPLGRVSNSEATLSLNWLPSDPYSLAVGTGFKWLRIYDIRGNTRPTSVVAHAKSVNGVTFDPFNSMRLATFSEEGTIKIWDLRMITRKEVFSIHSTPVTGASRTPKSLLEVEWCPTSQHRLATVHKDEDGFRLWDLSGSLPILPPSMQGSSALPQDDPSSVTAGIEDTNSNLPSGAGSSDISSTTNIDSAPSRLIRVACLSSSHSGGPPAPSLSSLSWHPSSKQRVLAITTHGLVEDMAIHESIPCGWGAAGPAFAVNEQLFIGQGRGNGTGGLLANANSNTGGGGGGTSNVMIPSVGDIPIVSPLSTLNVPSPSNDPTTILTFDISTRMRVKACLGYGVDVIGNRRTGEMVLNALRRNLAMNHSSTINANLPSGSSAVGAQLMGQESIRDEESIQRVWDWMIASERLASDLGGAGAPSSTATTTTTTTAGVASTKRSKFTGVLAALMPGGFAPVDASVPQRAHQHHVSDASSGSGTLLNLLKHGPPDVAPSSASNHTSPTAASGSSSSSLTPYQLTPASSSYSTQTGGGFLPSSSHLRVYLSQARSEAMLLCDGWFDIFTPGPNGTLEGAPAPKRKARLTLSGGGSSLSLSRAHLEYDSYLTSLESRGLYEHAARVAVFHLDLERALAALTLGAKQGPHTANLGLVAMALSGYANFAAANSNSVSGTGTASAGSLWSATWSTTLGEAAGKLSSNLIAIFRFLAAFASSSGTNQLVNGHGKSSPFQVLLDTPELSLSDKVGLILRFLPDDQLVEQIVYLTRELVAKGELDGLLLTGLNHIEPIKVVTNVSDQATMTPQQQQQQQQQSTNGTVNAPPSSTTMTTVTQTVSKSYTLDLLQSYLDRTADIQTTSILGAFAGVSIPFGAASSGSLPSGVGIGPFDTSESSNLIAQWSTLYRSLLNQWGLWAERAKFDVSRALLEKSWLEEESSRHRAPVKRLPHHTQIKAQISVRCNFCGQSLSLDSMSGGGGGPGSGGGSGGPPSHGGMGGGRTAVFRPRGRVGGSRVPDQNAARIRGCPHCKKSLPRCALCLVSFDCDTPHAGPIQSLKARKNNPLAIGQEEDIATGAGGHPLVHVEDDTRFDSNTMHTFGKWFTWCQACRHGGHAEHMADWFQTHSECPVTDCKCRCMSHDLLAPINGSYAHNSNAILQPIDSYSHDASHRHDDSDEEEEEDRHHSSSQHQLRDSSPISNMLLPHQSRFHINVNPQLLSNDPMQQQQALALSQIQSQYPQGIPLDVLAVAQAIQLMNLTRTTNTPSSGPMTVPSGMAITPDPMSPHHIQHQHQQPLSPPTPAPAGRSIHINPNTNTNANLHQSASSPYLTSLPSPISANSTSAPPQGSTSSTSTSSAPNGMQRAGSSVNLGARYAAAPATAKGTFPLTRW